MGCVFYLTVRVLCKIGTTPIGEAVPQTARAELPWLCCLIRAHLVNAVDDIGPCDGENVVVALEVLRVIPELLSCCATSGTIIGFV